MSFRSFALAALVLLSAFSVVGCGIRDDDGAVSENVLTAELVVPPASQELAAPTATAMPPTATSVPPTATMEVAAESEVETALSKRCGSTCPIGATTRLGIRMLRSRCSISRISCDRIAGLGTAGRLPRCVRRISPMDR